MANHEVLATLLHLQSKAELVRAAIALISNIREKNLNFSILMCIAEIITVMFTFMCFNFQDTQEFKK